MNRRQLLKSVTMALTAAAIPTYVLAQERRGEGKAEYHFRPEDREKLRGQYKDIDKVDRDHREHFVAGGHLPSDWRHHIQAVPSVVIRDLPPIPAGYVAGYYDGYAVVYDPRTGVILEVLDLT
jgi:Ni/Co efflux regulator RcnB